MERQIANELNRLGEKVLDGSMPNEKTLNQTTSNGNGRFYTEQQLTALGKTHENLARLNGYIESAQRYLLRSEGMPASEAIPIIEEKYAGVRKQLQERLERIDLNVYPENNFEPPRLEEPQAVVRGIRRFWNKLKEYVALAK